MDPKSNSKETLEEKYRALYENAPLPYQALNEDGSFKDVNPAWLRILGYSREEVIGKYYRDFLHPDWQAHFDKNFPEFKKRGYVKDVHFKIRHKNGDYRDITFEGCIGYYPDGSFRQTYCVFQDITEKRLIEENYLRNQYYLKKAQEIGKIGTWELDIVKNELKWTEENYKIFGIPIGTALTYEMFLDCVHPDDREFVNNEWSSALKNKFYEIEHRLIVEGKIKWVWEKADIIYDKNGKAISAIGFTQDITYRKKTENELIESEERYRLILDNSLDAIFLTSPDGKVYSANKAACEMFGMSEEEICKNSRDTLADPEDPNLSEFLEIRKQKGKVRCVLTYIRKDKSRFQGETSSSIFTDKNGHIRSNLIIRDVTERKNAEDKLKELKDKLQAEVEEKTKELQLRIAELERFQEATIEREFRIKELRDEIDRLKRE